MDYKVVSILTLMVASVLSSPYEHPIPVGQLEHGLHGAPKCPCGKVYFPVCGSDGVSYNNMCEFNCQARHVHKVYGKEMSVHKHARCEEIDY